MSKPRFSRKKELALGERWKQKILKKISKVPLNCINRSWKFQKFSLRSSQMRKKDKNSKTNFRDGKLTSTN